MEPLVASISKSALRANLATLRRQAGGAAICAMVKANAYGHGVDLVAPVLAEAGAEFLAVARVEEAGRLRQLGLDQPLLLCEPVVAPGPDSYLGDRLEAICRTRGIRPTVADLTGAEALAELAGRLQLRIPVHLKIDTGMGRSGLLPCDAECVCRAIRQSASLELEGIYTHFATADEPEDAFAPEQLACFQRIVAGLADAPCKPRYIHAANSAGVVRFGLPWLTLARPGLAVYGYSTASGIGSSHAGAGAQACGLAAKQEDIGTGGAGDELCPALRLTARLMLVKDLPVGHAVGYGCTWRATRPSRIGLVPIGYGDGYSRRFGNAAVMQVAGRDVPVVGRISMDMTMIDLTGLPDGGRGVRPGAEVVVISELRNAANSVENLARLAGTIPYEITCQLGQRIRRELVDYLAGAGLV